MLSLGENLWEKHQKAIKNLFAKIWSPSIIPMQQLVNAKSYVPIYRSFFEQVLLKKL